MDELPSICNRCFAQLLPGRAELYVVRIEAFADPSPPVISDDDLKRDLKIEIQRLMNSLKTVSAQEAMDQVYRRLTIVLCTPCYQEWIENPTGNR